MKILLIEDSEKKIKLIKKEVNSIEGRYVSLIDECTDLAAAAEAIKQNRYDVIITDLMLPYKEDATEQDATQEIINHILRSEKNAGTSVIAITAYEELTRDHAKLFTRVGLALIHYDEIDGGWREALKAFLNTINRKNDFDFIFICALEKERAALVKTELVVGSKSNIMGLDAQHLTLQGEDNLDKYGLAITLPGMGMVAASVVTSRVLENFSPKLICMIGICAGYSENTTLGQIVIANPCWEYQSGKFTDKGFEIAPYQVELDEHWRLTLKGLAEAEDTLSRLENGFIGARPQQMKQPKIGPFVSGSAVVANRKHIDKIANTQHRKTTALDMEVYGVYRAAKLSPKKTVFYACKTVVDFGDGDKDDELHDYGCLVSARFGVEALKRFKLE